MINFRRIFKIVRMLYRTFRRYRWRFLLLIALGLVAGIFGGIGITAAIPLFSLFAAPQVSIAPDIITRFISSFFSLIHLPLTPMYVMFFIVVLYIAKAGVQFFSRFMTDKITLEFSEMTQRSLFGNTLRASWPFLLKQKVGYLERYMLNDAQNAAAVLGTIGSMIMLATSVIMYGTVALSISVLITLSTVLFGAILFFITKPIYKKTRTLTARMALLEKETNHYITENLIGMKLIKAYRSEASIAQMGKTYLAHLRELLTERTFYSYLTGSFTEPAGFVFIAVLFFISYREPGFNIVAFGVTMYLVQRVFGFVQSIQGQMQSINGLVPYIQSVLRYRREVREHRELDEGTKNFQFQTSIQFQNVSFSYRPDHRVLSDVSFRILRGEMVGISGPSGSGKTTIVDLLLRLFSPSHGMIIADGVPVHEISLTKWRNAIGYVPQETFLLNDTIENNIRFYDASISETAIGEAAVLAHVTEFTDQLPEGLKTEVGERGVKLSGGQRQRIALARALARKPELLILDEATSNLDTASEAVIQKAISKLKHHITIIAIAHRLSTIADADRMIHISEGHVQES